MAQQLRSILACKSAHPMLIKGRRSHSSSSNHRKAVGRSYFLELSGLVIFGTAPLMEFVAGSLPSSPIV